MGKINAINNKSGSLTIDPGASGDSFVQFDINTTGEFRIGVDDDAGDSFKISQGSALGSNDTFIMTAAGERTMPLQSAFLAYANANLTNVTGDGTNYTVVFNTEVFDQNSDFDGTSTFTAPVTGRYHFIYNGEWDDIAAAHTNSYTQIVTSNRTYQANNFDPGNFASGGNLGYHQEVLADMDASDTAVFKTAVVGSTKVVDLVGAATMNTMASGYLAC